MEKYVKEIQLAKKIALRAKDLIEDLSKKEIQIKNKDVHDFVTNVDTSVEKLIVAELKEEFPDYQILAEESGKEDSKSSYKWIIDPIDGTTNFTKEIPIYAVSIGLEHNGKPVGGVVYNTAIDEMFTAIKGEGAYLNNKRIHVSKQTKIDNILVGTGFPFKKSDNYEKYIDLFRQIAIETAGIRRPGAASLDLCWLACGRYDAFFEFGLNPWDIAAGSVIVSESGGIISDAKGGNDFIYGKSVIGANSKEVYDFMIDTIENYYYK